jgi:G3E family GTPase
LALLLDRVPGPDGADETLAADRHRPSEHRLASMCRWSDTTTRECLLTFVERHGKRIERIKGILWIDGELSEVQCVREHVALRPYQGTAPARGRLVFISSVLTARELRELVDECFVTDDQLVGIS